MISAYTNSNSVTIIPAATGTGTGLQWTISRITTTQTNCGESAMAVIGFSWDDTAVPGTPATSTIKYADWVTQPTSGSSTSTLVRYLCEQRTIPGPITPLATLVLASNVKTAAALREHGPDNVLARCD